jgi:hypothetical protein
MSTGFTVNLRAFIVFLFFTLPVLSEGTLLGQNLTYVDLHTESTFNLKAINTALSTGSI